MNIRVGLADMPDGALCCSGSEETPELAFWDHVREWTARIEPKKLVLLDIGYVVDIVLPPFKGDREWYFSRSFLYISGFFSVEKRKISYFVLARYLIQH